MTNPLLDQLAEQKRRADQIERVAVALADFLDADPDHPLPVGVIDAALQRAHEIVYERRLDMARQLTADRRAADTPMDSEKPHG